ncbi:MAG: DUF4292 domain-containing protein [Bacteroidales bacterium]|nr:DUF4292 domain-containing protein [Bacteroidales bacterium]
MKKWKEYNSLDCIFVCVSLIILFCLLACKTRPNRHTNVTQQDSVIVDTQKNIVKQLFKPKVYAFKYNWYSTRMSVSVKNIDNQQEQISLNAFWVNKKDSIIFITLSKMGIEGARFVLTTDSVKYINHLDKEYYWGDYRIFNKLLGFPVDFYMIQSLFMGGDLPYFDKTCTKDSSENTITYMSSSRKSLKNNMIVEQKLQTDQLQHTIYHYIKDVKTLNNIAISFNNFVAMPDGQFCFQYMDISIPAMNIQLQCQLKGTKINVPGPTSIKRSEKYKPIKIQ